MLANELRIGNYVECSDVIHYIDELRNNGAHTFCLYPYDSRKYNVFEGHVYYKNLNPIPLTEQWLKDFGFGKKYSDEWVSPCDNYLLTHNFRYGKGLTETKHYYFELVHNDYDYKTISEFVYVHQLQNLYFCLTGKELTKC